MKLILSHRLTGEASACPYRVVDEQGKETAWANDFLDAQHMRQLSPRSLRAYAYDLLHFARWFQNQPQSLSEINESTLLDYVRQRAGNNASCHCPPKSWKCFKTTFAWNGP
jgi:site-specific recombinase XerD